MQSFESERKKTPFSGDDELSIEQKVRDTTVILRHYKVRIT